MAAVRTFVAVELPGEVAQVLSEMQARLSHLDGRVRWVRPEGMHLTLKFLGDVEEARIPEVLDAVREAACRVAPFTLQTGALGGGPGPERARVVWVRVAGEREALIGLQAGVEAAVAGLGFPKERRRFYPHLTLGRARRRPVRLPEGPADAVRPVRFQVEHVTLFKSDLRPEGAVYTALGHGLLGGSVRG